MARLKSWVRLRLILSRLRIPCWSEVTCFCHGRQTRSETNTSGSCLKWTFPGDKTNMHSYMLCELWNRNMIQTEKKQLLSLWLEIGCWCSDVLVSSDCLCVVIDSVTMHLFLSINCVSRCSVYMVALQQCISTIDWIWETKWRDHKTQVRVLYFKNVIMPGIMMFVWMC